MSVGPKSTDDLSNHQEDEVRANKKTNIKVKNVQDLS